MKNNYFEWLKLDNAAKIFPGQNSRSWSNVFRVSMELKQEIDPELLRVALDKTLKRIPGFNVRIRYGFFWHYFEINPKTCPIRPDIKNHCYRINFKENNGFLFRLYYHGNRISMDVFHALADGYGAAVFLSTLVGEYLRIQGENIPYNQFVLDVNEKPRDGELEDAYNRYASSRVKLPRWDKWAYHSVGTKLPRYMSNFVIGIMSFEQLHALSKKYGVTVTEFLAALMLDIHYKKQLSEKKKQKEVSVQIPVNLRKAFPSETLRNFVLCLRVKIDPNLGEYTFEEIVKSVALQLRLANDPKLLNAMMSQNMKLERNKAMKYTPLIIKNLGVGIGFVITGEQTTSTLVTNLGPIVLPKEMMNFVDKFFVFTGPGKLNGARCGVASLGDNLSFTFSNCYEESDIEREFFTRLVKMGVHVKIESNRE